MSELHLGYMSNEELANWFQISESSFKNYKKRKLEVLKDFCDYEIIKGRVYIKEIIQPIYIKNLKKTYELVKSKMDENWAEDGLDSCATVSKKIERELAKTNPEVLMTLKDSTLYNYTRQSRTELYGKPFLGPGSLGICEYLWCKKEGDGADTRYRRLTADEEKIKEKLIKKYFGDATEKQIIVEGMVMAGEIKKEEAWEVLEELTNMNGGNFLSFLGELQAKIGCQVVRGTLVTRNNENYLKLAEDL